MVAHLLCASACRLSSGRNKNPPAGHRPCDNRKCATRVSRWGGAPPRIRGICAAGRGCVPPLFKGAARCASCSASAGRDTRPAPQPPCQVCRYSPIRVMRGRLEPPPFKGAARCANYGASHTRLRPKLLPRLESSQDAGREGVPGGFRATARRGWPGRIDCAARPSRRRQS
jgi:hypothetical protein